MGDWLPRENRILAAKTSDAMLDKISELIVDREIARMELAAERVAHRITTKQLSEAVGMALR